MAVGMVTASVVEMVDDMGVVLEVVVMVGAGGVEVGLVAASVVEMVDDMGEVLVVVVMVGAGGVEVVGDREVVMVAADRVEEV